MSISDRDLGMHRAISRRDLLGGGATLVAGTALLGCPHAPALAQTPSAYPQYPQNSYPPSLGGLRGSHAGAFEVAHEMALQGRRDWGTPTRPDRGTYDLVVVGAGVSGLAAAWFWRAAHPDARILLIENHDDFGGHAKRNEFEVGGRRLIGYGGSQSLEAPGAYSEVVKELFAKLGIHPSELRDAYDDDFYKRHGLAAAMYFDRATWGRDALVKGPLIDPGGFLPAADSGASLADALAAMPVSDAARAQLSALWTGREDGLPEHSILAEPGYLASISYRDFLTRHLEVTEEEVLRLLHHLPAGYFGQGIDVIPAAEAIAFGMPGLNRTSLGPFEGILRGLLSFATEPYYFHFPDGNASVARMLVRDLIPDAAPGESMADIVLSPFDYGRLDVADAQVRLRLRSTVVDVRHTNDQSAVDVRYVRDGVAEQVHAENVVLACYNMAIPHLCEELPEPQRAALSELVKLPLVYTSVALANWNAFERLGVGVVFSPTSWHQFGMLDFPVSMGGVRFSADPGEPIVMHLSRSCTVPGLAPRPQARAGRAQLLGTSFEEIERGVRTQLAGALGEGGFDPARDIAGITVNRWPHGYAWSPSRLSDPEYAQGEAPHEIGRRPIGRIAIANSDAGARAYLDEAIDQARRATDELLARA